MRHLNFSGTWIKKIDGLLESFDKKKIKVLKTNWPTKITHGFFHANRTDLSIERIKNPHLKDHGETLTGYVVEAVKEEHLILLTRKSFRRGAPLLGITPEGRECEILTDIIHTTDGQPAEDIISGKLYQAVSYTHLTLPTTPYV